MVFSNQFIQSIVDWVVIFTTDLLMPVMGIAFVVTISLRFLIYFTIKREEWFAREFGKRVRKFIDARDDQAIQSFYVIAKRLLEITYYELFEIRSIMKRRNPDVIMSITDRIFLIQQGSARLVHDLLRQIKYLKWGERPKFREISNHILRSNPCFTKLFGVIPLAPFNDFLNTVPGLFIVGGIFGTFLGIMKALPELGGMNLVDVEGSKLIMDDFLIKISFSMSTSIIGILFSVLMGVCNTFFSCEKVFMETVEQLESQLDVLWNLSSSNKLPAELEHFEAERDPIEVISENLIAKELAVEVGFVNFIWPISKWWKNLGKAPLYQAMAKNKNEAVAPRDQRDQEVGH